MMSDEVSFLFGVLGRENGFSTCGVFLFVFGVARLCTVDSLVIDEAQVKSILILKILAVC
jgi:hypothetical protein